VCAKRQFSAVHISAGVVETLSVPYSERSAMNKEFRPQVHYRPRLYKRSLNLSSDQAQRVGLLITYVAVAYPIVLIAYIALSIIGQSYPGLWQGLTTFLNGMSITFNTEMSGPLLSTSVLLAILCVALTFFIALRWVRWQFSLSILFGLSLWSLTYLICSVIFLVRHDHLSHIIVLLTATVFFIVVFVQNSLITFYWNVKCYGDVVLEAAIVGIFGIVTLYKLIPLFGG
jgi:hypothetical protein